MRLIACLALLLVPAALHAADGTCEYRSPAHPGWDFFTDCSYSVTTSGGVTTTRATVSNGSKFTIEERTAPDTGTLVNGKKATAVEAGASRCLRTSGAGELICIHPPGAAPMGVSAPEPEAAPVSPKADDTFGGGEKGFCLLTSQDGPSESLVAHSSCVKREDCTEEKDGSGLSCLAEYDWPDGRHTETVTTPDWVTLDGGAAEPAKDGCFVDAGAKRTFCFAVHDLKAADFPALATGR